MARSRSAALIAVSLAAFSAVVAQPAIGTAGPRTAAISPVSRRTNPGEQLWVRRYNGPANRADVAHAIGVSPDGSKVVVTGESGPGLIHPDYATVAYDASTGTGLWVRR